MKLIREKHMLHGSVYYPETKGLWELFSLYSSHPFRYKFNQFHSEIMTIRHVKRRA